MSKRLVTILWAIAGLLAALTLFVKLSQNKDDENTAAVAQGDALFGDFKKEKENLKKIASVQIKDANNTVTLTKDEGQWSVVERADYKADFPKLTRFLRSLTEVTAAQSKKAGPAFNERFGMDPEAENQENHGYQIVISDANGKEMKSLSIGKSATGEQANAQGGAGKYIRLGNEPETVYAVNESFRELTANPKDWVDGNFITVNGIRSIELTPGPEAAINGWTVSRSNTGSDFTIQNLNAGREPQADKLTPLKTVLSGPSFEDVLTAEDAKARRNEGKANILTIKTFEGFEYLLDYAPAKTPQTGTVGSPVSSGFIVKVDVSADFPKERTKVEGETAEEAKKADADFAEQAKLLANILKKEKAFSGRYFEVADYTLSPLNIGLDALAKPVVRTEAIAPTQGFGPLAPQPPLDRTPPPSAVAPPVPTPAAEEAEAVQEESSSNNSDALNGLTEKDIQRIVREAKEADAQEQESAE